jgi:hypothetical protein
MSRSSNHISPKAWMTDTDANLIERILGHVRGQDQLRVLEWGSGRSTASFTEYLRKLGMRCQWVTVEHHREFFEQSVLPLLSCQNVLVRFMDDTALSLVQTDAEHVGVLALVFDKGALRPDSTGLEEARSVDLDDYVTCPASLGMAFDVVIVDGRRRRRCLLQAASLMTGGGVTLLHDARRPYYHCAFDKFNAHRFIGDDLWIGASQEADIVATITDVC